MPPNPADDGSDSAYRRRVLGLISSAIVGGFAGCGGDSDDTPTDTEIGGNDNGTDNGNGGTTTAPETDTTTPTDTATPTGTPGEEPLGSDPSTLLSLNDVSVAVSETTTLTTSLSNPYLFEVHSVTVDLEVEGAGDAVTVSPTGDTSIDTLPPGEPREIGWEITASESADDEYPLNVTVSYESETDQTEQTISRQLAVFDPGEVPGDGLQAYFPLDSDTPTDAVSDNDATINGDPEVGATGIVDGAYDFDGQDDYLAYPDVGVTYDGSADWTASLWINADSLPSSDDYWLWHPRAKSDIFIWVEVDSDEILFSTYPGDYDNLRSGVTLPTEEWVHVCAVSDTGADSQYRLFVNGTLEAESGLSDPDNVSASNLIGGQNAPDLDRRYFDGRIDEVLLYDRALAQEEVAALAGQGS